MHTPEHKTPATAAGSDIRGELAAYAAVDEQTRGRAHAEAPPEYRREFQRDRDRIVHSTAFRRLVYKTQVFVNHEGDMYRTRLTHSLEVAQIGRSIARVLRLNEHLVEAIALSHDLGHTAFGHAGQDSLNTCMRDYGGFEHNLQSLRVVDELEEKYAEFPGLNLTFETREGILKHCSASNARGLGELGRRFLDRSQPSLEAQVTDLADAMRADAGVLLDELRVDGGAAANDLLMQMQADLLQRPVVRPKRLETTALGAAYMAGLATGVWSSVDELRANWRIDRRFEPQITAAEAESRRDRWRDAVARSRSWVRPGDA